MRNYSALRRNPGEIIMTNQLVMLSLKSLK
jgi:hypothetical protein